MSFAKATASGLVGACTLTLIHESARRVIPNAPRMDILGMRVIARSFKQFGGGTLSADQAHTMSLVGDIVSNSLYYSLVGLAKPRNALLLGTALGLAAGVGAVVLPAQVGLGDAPSGRTNETKAMTVGWYLAGGVVAGLVFQALGKKKR